MHRISQTAPSSNESSIEGCFHALGGLRLSFSNLPIEIFAEGRYMVVGDGQTPNLAAVVTGFTFRVFKR